MILSLQKEGPPHQTFPSYLELTLAVSFWKQGPVLLQEVNFARFLLTVFWHIASQHFELLNVWKTFQRVEKLKWPGLLDRN